MKAQIVLFENSCFLFQIGSLDGMYLFEHSHVKKRSTDYAHEHHTQLKEHPKVSNLYDVT